MQDIKKSKEILSSVLESKMENITKLYFDVFYRMKMRPFWEKQVEKCNEEIKEHDERIKNIDKELDVLRVMRGRSDKSRLKIMDMEDKKSGVQNEQRKVNGEKDILLRAIHEIDEMVDILDGLIGDRDEYFKHLKYAIENTEEVRDNVDGMLKNLKK
uniref:Uncharacterized protein n=1 Tax=viral metagenome TaxID=1070528 RepID=A0A6M3LSG5_9ZZZZ